MILEILNAVIASFAVVYALPFIIKICYALYIERQNGYGWEKPLFYTKNFDNINLFDSYFGFSKIKK